LQEQLRRAAARPSGATVFAYRVADPRAYGVVTFDGRGHAVDIEEKPDEPKSNFAVTGLYFYDSDAPAIVRTLKPSARGELEITALNQCYLRERSLRVEVLGRGSAWMDTGTPDDLLSAANYIQAIEHRQGLMVGCPEECALRNGWINHEELRKSAGRLGKTTYSAYLQELALADERRVVKSGPERHARTSPGERPTAPAARVKAIPDGLEVKSKKDNAPKLVKARSSRGHPIGKQE